MNSKIQTVLVTGGSGYIGSHVVSELLQDGYKVRIYDQFMFGDKHIADLKKNKNLSIFKGEIGDVQKLIEVMKDADAVVHLAGIVGDPASKVNEELTVQMNIISTRTVIEISKVFNIKRFIFASSCSVYGASKGFITETSKLNPVSLYAKTKIDSEKEILEDKSKNFHPTILRFATVFGDSRRPRFDLVANLFVAHAYNNGMIMVTGSKQWRPFIHPADIARVVIKLIEAPAKKVDREVFNTGDDDLNVTILDLANLVAEIVQKDKKGKKVRVVVKDDTEDKRNYRVSFKKINQTLDFKASTSLKEGLSEIYEKFKTGKYKLDFKDPFYINLEMTKMINKKYLKKHQLFDSF